MLFLEIDQHSRNDDLKALNKLLTQTITDVTTVAKDNNVIAEKISSSIQSINAKSIISNSDKNECTAFLEWLRDGHFTFLAYDEYTVNEQGVQPLPNSALGLFSGQHGQPKAQAIEHISEKQQAVIHASYPLFFAKSGHLSSVHRAAYSDYVVVKKFDAQGNVVGGHRFMGLYKHNVYLDSATSIPIIRQKIQMILEHSTIPEGTYNYTELTHILGTFPVMSCFWPM